MVEKRSHEAMLANLMEEKEVALREERARWEVRLSHELSQAKLRHDAERQVWIFSISIKLWNTSSSRIACLYVAP